MSRGNSKSSTIIDAHQHFWVRARGDYAWLTSDLAPIYRDFLPQDLVPELDRNDIGRTILVQAAPTVDETRFLLDIAERTDFVAGVVGWIDMESPDALSQFSELCNYPLFLGIRPMIQDLEDPEWMLRPSLHRVYAYLVTTGKTFDALVLPHHLKPLLKLVEQYPELAVIIDHAAKPAISDSAFDQWADDIALIANKKNVFCKLSGILTEAGPSATEKDLAQYVNHLINIFSTDRLVWGSDWPVLNLVSDYSTWFQMAQSALSRLNVEQQQAVFGRNAVKFYDLQNRD